MPWASSRSSATARPSSVSASSRRAASRRSSSLPSRERRIRSASDSPTRRCCAPSWRSRSSRRRSASPASMMRAREERRSSSWARASPASARSRSRGAPPRDSSMLGVVEDVGSMEDQGDRAAVADERSRSSTVWHNDVDRPTARVHVAVLADRVGELEVRVAQRLGEPVPQAAGGSRLAQLDDQPREGRARAASSQQAPRDGCRQGRQSGRLTEPQPALELAASHEPALEARRERPGDEAEVGTTGEDYRCHDALPRPARASHSPSGDHDQEERPGQAEMESEPVEVVDAPGLVRRRAGDCPGIAHSQRSPDRRRAPAADRARVPLPQEQVRRRRAPPRNPDGRPGRRASPSRPEPGRLRT